MQTGVNLQSRSGMSLVLDVLTEPADAFRYLAQHRRLGLALVVYVISLLPTAYGPSLDVADDLTLLFQPEASGLMLGLQSSISNVLLLFVSAALLHLVARLLGGRGRYAQIVQAEGMAALPMLLVAPFTVLANMGVLPFLYHVAVLAAMVWSVVLSVVAIRETYGFTTGRAIAALVLQAVAAVVLAVGVALVIGLLAILVGAAM